MSNSLYSFTKSALVEGLLYLDGHPIKFDDYPWSRAIYNGNFPSLLLKTGRQVSKSTLASCFMISESIAYPHFRTLYVAPSESQTGKFSSTRLTKMLQYSPLVRKRYCGVGSTNNVFLKILNNGSEIVLSYAQDDADRIRGISADRIFIDECQDIELSSIIPVVKECQANSDYGWMCYTGTPKVFENGIEHLWSQSTRAEWVMKCGGCGSWNFIDNRKSIGLKGPICIKCGHLLNPRDGKWYEFNPGARTKGFHISQPILPRNAEVPERWDRIVDKLDTYTSPKFNNEVLGVSDAIGTRMISLEDLKALCKPTQMLLAMNNKDLDQYRAIGAGIDWSGGGTMATSRTSVAVFAITHKKKYKLLYYKIFPGRNQVEDVREAADICNRYRAKIVCGDAGEGAVANSLAKEILGEQRVFQVQYAAHAKLFSWNQKDRYLIDKTAFIDSFMLDIKRAEIEFPREEECKHLFEDILAEYEEVTLNGLGRKIWRHSPSVPDDALHACIFAMTACKIINQEFSLY